MKCILSFKGIPNFEEIVQEIEVKNINDIYSETVNIMGERSDLYFIKKNSNIEPSPFMTMFVDDEIYVDNLNINENSMIVFRASISGG